MKRTKKCKDLAVKNDKMPTFADKMKSMKVVYEDNHIIIVDKACGELVQGDATGDEPLVETLKRWIKEKYNKPGNVFLGVTHRIDRPTSGLVIFARTSKALSRLNELFRRGEVSKTYWAVVDRVPLPSHGTLTHWLTPRQQGNKTMASLKETPGSQKAVMDYRLLASGENYHLLEIELLTGRKHQIRAQLSAIGVHIKGDLKYGARRSNPDGGISLQAHRVHFIHPVSGKEIDITAPVPDDRLWQDLAASVNS